METNDGKISSKMLNDTEELGLAGVDLQPFGLIWFNGRQGFQIQALTGHELINANPEIFIPNHGLKRQAELMNADDKSLLPTNIILVSNK